MINLVDCNKSEFVERMRGKNLYCFGAGKYLQNFVSSHYGIPVKAVIDNNRYKDTTPILIDNAHVKVISPTEFAKLCNSDSVVIITCLAIEEVVSQLDAMQECDGLDCYVQLFLNERTEHTEINIKSERKQAVIPKKIHYCWFGGRKIPDEYMQYIDTWKMHCPDYEIIRWDESNYDVYKNMYIRQAYEKKKWAFVTDYARVDILYREGGIYFDTDVELLASFDKFLVWDMFCGFEYGNYIAWGLGVGSVKGHPILKQVLDIYEAMPFIKEDGSLNLKPCPIIQSEVLEQYGFKMNGKFQEKNGVALFPQEFFGPIRPIGCFGNITEYSHSIHHYAASWVDKIQLGERDKSEERFRKIKEHNKKEKKLGE